MSLRKQKEETEASVNLHEKQKINDVEKQNLLLAERLEQMERQMKETLAEQKKDRQEIIESQKKTQSLLTRSVEVMQETKTTLNSNVHALANGADSTLLTRQQKILDSFERREKDRHFEFEHKMKKFEENKIVGQTVREWGGTFLHLLITVCVTVVLASALRWGIWEGLRIGVLFEWGSQWIWLRVIMIGMLVAGAGVLIFSMYQSVKNFFNL